MTETSIAERLAQLESRLVTAEARIALLESSRRIPYRSPPIQAIPHQPVQVAPTDWRDWPHQVWA